MIKQSLFANEIIANMQNELQHPFEKKHASQNLGKAVDYLHSAIEIFEEKGLTRKADQLLDILEKIAQKSKNHKTHTNVVSNLPPVGKMMEKGITLADFDKMNSGDLRAKARINKVLHELGLSTLDIAQAIGVDNVMKQEDSAAFANPHSSSSNILRMIEDPLGKETTENLEPGDEFSINSIASKHKKPKDPRRISDPHTKGLTSEKMVRNLLDHGTEFNMSDDGVADDLLNLDINDADLEVLENEALSELDFEDEI